MTDSSPSPAPEIDQIWADNDPRSSGRYVRILFVGATHVEVERVSYDERDQTATALPGARRTRISVGRLRPTSTGYRYVGTAGGAR